LTLDETLPKKDVFTPKEAAKHLKMSKSTIYAWIEAGILKATKRGPKLIWITREEILAKEVEC